MIFKAGDRVRVSNHTFASYNQTGTIQRPGNTCDVLMDSGLIRSYKECNLGIIKENKLEDKKMSIVGDFKVAKVKFLSGANTNTTYEYAMFDDYKVGDTVVVASAHHGLGVAKIDEVITKEEAVTKNFEREIVDRVDMSTYEDRKKNRARVQELKNKMTNRVKELNNLAIFEMMAEKDPELKDMLEEYKVLIN